MILIKCLIQAGRAEDGKRVLEKLIELGRHWKWRSIRFEITLLSIALNDANATVEFSAQSGSAWLQQYGVHLYETRKTVKDESLADRQFQSEFTF